MFVKVANSVYLDHYKMNLNDIEVKIGQVWAEQMTPLYGDTWYKLHFVTSIKSYSDHWNNNSQMIISETVDRDCINTDSGKFKRFKFTGYTLCRFLPCFEALTLDKLHFLSDKDDSTCLYKPNYDLYNLADNLINMLDNIKEIGGQNRYYNVVNTIKDLSYICGASGIDNYKDLLYKMQDKGIIL